MFSFFNSKPSAPLPMPTSQLFDEQSFYTQFTKDLKNAKSEVIIESPFITKGRVVTLIPVFAELQKKGVKIFIITRPSHEHEEVLARQAEYAIQVFEDMEIQVFTSLGNHHRKLAIIDREVLWEGSLNILSQTRSREIMRRIVGKELATETFNFLNFGKLI
jgi:phosphatidylserine/phosphatidylglycerophosphate/cardiolipin synthase-like enzyme